MNIKHLKRAAVCRRFRAMRYLSVFPLLASLQGCNIAEDNAPPDAGQLERIAMKTTNKSSSTNLYYSSPPPTCTLNNPPAVTMSEGVFVTDSISGIQVSGSVSYLKSHWDDPCDSGDYMQGSGSAVACVNMSKIPGVKMGPCLSLGFSKVKKASNQSGTNCSATCNNVCQSAVSNSQDSTSGSVGGGYYASVGVDIGAPGFLNLRAMFRIMVKAAFGKGKTIQSGTNTCGGCVPGRNLDSSDFKASVGVNAMGIVKMGILCSSVNLNAQGCGAHSAYTGNDCGTNESVDLASSFGQLTVQTAGIGWCTADGTSIRANIGQTDPSDPSQICVQVGFIRQCFPKAINITSGTVSACPA